jgi:hypothetical protein
MVSQNMEKMVSVHLFYLKNERTRFLFHFFGYRGKGSFDRLQLDRVHKTIDGFKKRQRFRREFRDRVMPSQLTRRHFLQQTATAAAGPSEWADLVLLSPATAAEATVMAADDRAAYSYRSASIGSSRDAFHAG